MILCSVPTASDSWGVRYHVLESSDSDIVENKRSGNIKHGVELNFEPQVKTDPQN